jgi:hypothetical protein
MEALDYWRLSDNLSVIQASLLILGEDPSELQNFVETNSPQDRPPGYDAIQAAILDAIFAKRLPASIGYTDESEMELSWHATTIRVEDLKVWLKSKGITTGFFFSTGRLEPDYLSNAHPNYSPKLAAAINAWKAVSTDSELRRGRSVKQALIVWLRQHAHEFGLTKEDGKPNEQGIEDVSKIANWDTKGGAPGRRLTHPPVHHFDN